MNDKNKLTCEKKLQDIEIGNKEIFSFCKTFTDKVKGDKIPKCDQTAIYILDKNKKGVLVMLLSGVKKIENA